MKKTNLLYMAKKFDTSALRKDLTKELVNKSQNSKVDNLLKGVVDVGDLKELAEFKDLIPPLSTEEFKQLEENILMEGCRDSLVLWFDGSNYIIIDGHNRYHICRKHNINFKTITLDFESKQAVIDWMVSNQLGKRNITEETKSYLRGLQYRREKGRKGGDRKSKGQSDLLINTSEKLAEQHKVSEKTIKRDEQYSKAIDNIAQNLGNDIKHKILNKQISSTKKQIQNIAALSSEDQSKIFSRILEEKSKTLRDSLRHIQLSEGKNSNKKNYIKKIMISFPEENIKSIDKLKNIVEKLNKSKQINSFKISNISWIELKNNEVGGIDFSLEGNPEDIFKMGIILSKYIQ